MRVAFVLKGYPRLSETFIAQEILGLENAGLDISIFALRRPTDRSTHPIVHEIRASVAYLCEYLHEDPMRVLRAGWTLRGRLWRALPDFWRDLKRDLSRNRIRRFGQALVLAAELPPGITHLHAHFIHTPASVARYAAKILALGWSVSAHAKDIWTTQDWDLREKLGDAQWAVTCTQSGGDHLNTLAPPQLPVHLVYHGLDLTRFAALPVPRALADGSDPARPVRLLSVGRAVEKKGFDQLLKALAQLPSELHWTWTHIGGGELLENLISQAKALGLESRISWRGAQAQQDVLEAYRGSDLFVLPCRIADDGDRDGLPNVLVEAQSQGLACLSTTVSAIPELIRDGGTGVLVKSGDIGALADAIIALIADPARRFQLGKAGMVRVRGHFSHHHGIERLMRLFFGNPPNGQP